MYHVIINPAARSGKGEHLWRTIAEPYLMKHKVEYISYFSQKPGDICRLAEELTKDASSTCVKHIVLFGGDGTFNELLQGIRDFSTVILGYVPVGSSNDLARSLRLPQDTLQAVKAAFFTGTEHKLDIGCVTFKDKSRRYFAVSCGAGFDAAVCEETNRSGFKRVLNRMGMGKLAYLTIAIKQLFAAKSVSCRITLDASTPINIPKYLFMAGMIHPYEGGGFYFCPKANPEDGILDLCSVSTLLPRWVILLILPTAYIGKHYLFPGIRSYRAHRIQLNYSSPVWIHTDGEALRCDDAFTISCKKNLLTLRY